MTSEGPGHSVRLERYASRAPHGEPYDRRVAVKGLQSSTQDGALKGQRPMVLVRGVGDVASAVAHRLVRDGFPVVLHQGPEAPLAHRRKMSFSDAWFDGGVELEGVTAERLDDLSSLSVLLGQRIPVPMLISGLEELLQAYDFPVLIDARMRKRERPEDQRGLAPLVVGLGPGFIAGANVDWAVETGWGDSLGMVIRAGPTLPLSGEPQVIGNTGRERIVYAPCSGRWRVRKDIGQAVTAGEVVADIDGLPVTAPIAGTVRGTVRGGVAIRAGAKVLEIDPRQPDAARFAGLGERPRKIAAGAAEALAEWAAATPLEPASFGESARR